MTQQNNSTGQQIHPVSLGKLMLIGGGFALALIGLFLFPAEHVKPEWGKYWMIKPLIVVPSAGVLGGAVWYLLDHLRYQDGWKTALAYILSILGYFIILWLGTVAGLNGTYWD